MESYLRIGLFIIAGLILFFILFEAWNRRRCLRLMDLPKKSNHFTQQEAMPTEPLERIAPSLSAVDDLEPRIDASSPLLMISVLAKPGTQFASYDLLQSILATGLQFGEGNLFHYICREQQTKLFSLAAATRSGEFDLTNVGNLSCKGLILFLDIDTVMDPVKALELMHTSALLLADDLDGMLYADPETPWTDDIFKQYQKKVKESQCLA